VLERVGDVAYKLALPVGSRIHDVFHVGLLKPFHGEPLVVVPDLPPLQHGRAVPQPAAVLKRRLARGQHELLVQWKGAPSEEASWVSRGISALISEVSAPG